MDDRKQEDPVVVKRETEENMYVSSYHVTFILFITTPSVNKSTGVAVQSHNSMAKHITALTGTD